MSAHSVAGFLALNVPGYKHLFDSGMEIRVVTYIAQQYWSDVCSPAFAARWALPGKLPCQIEEPRDCDHHDVSQSGKTEM
jgi:hypothetical protein